MNIENLVAIDVHTHAWKSALQVGDAPTDSQEAMGRYFRYQPQHQTVPEMADYYRRLKMAFVVFTVDSPAEKGKITNEEIAQLAREHNHAQVVAIGARMHTAAEATEIVEVFLATQPSTDERDQRRIDQLLEYERTGTPPPLPV